MKINPATYGPVETARRTPAATKPPPPAAHDDTRLRKTFNSFVGQVFFGQMLKAMRKTLGKPAYFYGGQAEEIFQQQLDQVLGEKLAEASGGRLSDPMLELFKLNRR